MSAPPFMQLYIADYLSDTRHLTTEQHGAYLLLLMAMWRAGGALPADAAKLARMAGLSPARWARIEADVLALFLRDGGRLTHKRLAAELAKTQRLSDARSEAGARGAQAKLLKTRAAVPAEPERRASPAEPCQISEVRVEEADASVAANAANAPSGSSTAQRGRRIAPQARDEGGVQPPSDTAPTPHRGDYPDAFEAVWRAYPHVRGRSSKTRAFGCWRRLPAQTRQALPEAIARYRADGREPKAECGAPALERWLREARYLDWLQAEAPTAEPHAPAGPAFAGPAEIRAAVAAARGEAFARAWLDRCAWDQAARAVVSANGFVLDRLGREAGPVLAGLDVRLARRAPRSAPDPSVPDLGQPGDPR